jgi:hypothetical protein
MPQVPHPEWRGSAVFTHEAAETIISDPGNRPIVRWLYAIELIES